jgi:hypothetical protein
MPAEEGEAGTDTTGLDALRAHDPAFDIDTFLALAQRTFWLLGQAYAECQPDLCRSVMSDELWQQHRQAIEDVCGRGRNLRPDALAEGTARLHSIRSDASWDTIAVDFAAVWREVAGKAGRHAAAGADRAERRRERWCFHRPATASTPGSGSLVDTTCDNCGAPLDPQLGGKCRFCGTAVAGTGGGWVLIRIDELAEPEPLAAPAPPPAQPPTGGAAASARGRAVAARARPGCGCLPGILILVLLAAGATLAVAATTAGSLHHRVARYITALQHTELHGQVTLSGGLILPPATFDSTAGGLGGPKRCDAQAPLTHSVTISTGLPDGAKVKVEALLLGGEVGAGIYDQPRVNVLATSKPKGGGPTRTWEVGAGSKVHLQLNADDTGALQFTNLVSPAPGLPPLSGSATWTCAVR